LIGLGITLVIAFVVEVYKLSSSIAGSGSRGTRGLLVLVAALPLLLSACATRSLVAPTRDEVLLQIFRSSVQVVHQREGAVIRSGSGVMIAAEPGPLGTDCLVVTSGHTLSRRAPTDEVYVLLGRRQAAAVKARAEVIALQDDAAVDLALLKIRTEACFAARPGPSPALGDPVWVVAFPLGGNMTLAGGIVSQLTPAEPPIRARFTVDASVSYGASGAGVFEARTGRLLGLVEGFGTARVSFGGDASASYIDMPVPGMTYVNPMERVQEFLRAVGFRPGVVRLDSRGTPGLGDAGADLRTHGSPESAPGSCSSERGNVSFA